MKRKINNIKTLVIYASVIVFLLVTSSLTFAMEYRSGVTEIDTTYAGRQEIPNHTLNNIQSAYGEDARNLYIECAKSGDFYDFRKATGWMKPITSLDSNMEHDVQTLTRFMELEMYTVSVCGPYGTIQDYLAWCQKEGISSASDMNRFTFDCITGKHSWPKKITEAEYLANHKNAKAAPAAANNAQVEALKTYKGNTAEFNAYVYYTRYADLQSAIGPNGDLLLKHYNEYGKKEQRLAK